MLIAGADVSGNTRGDGQSRHIAFVLGTPESINRLHNQIGLREIHMVDLDESKRKQVLENLEFTENDIIAWCLNVERQKIIDYITTHEKINPKNKQKSRIQKHFDYCLLQYVKDSIEQFTYSKNFQLSDICVQCDSDMDKTALNWKMQTSYKGKAYEIADAIAWCNEHGKKIKQCVEIDLRDKLRQQMEYDLLK